MTRHVGWLAAATIAAACAAPDDAARGVSVSNAVAPAPVATGAAAEATMAVYATLVNHESGGDTLIAVETAAAHIARLHATMDHGGMSMMMLAEHLVVPPDSTIALAPGGMHVMLESLERLFVPGDTVHLTFVFQHAGRVPVVARVVAYDELDDALRSGGSS